MAQLRAAWSRIPALGGLIGFAIGLRWLLHRNNPKRRPTATELMDMSDADFAAFVASTGIKTVTTAGLARSDALAD